MKSTKSKTGLWLTLLLSLILSYSASSQRIQSSSVSCQDSVRATARAWFAQKSRADTLKKSLTDTTVRFRQYRKAAIVRQDSTAQVGFKAGKKAGQKEGRAYGRRQILTLEAVVIVIVGIFKFLVFR
ncbi:hypothetical protein BWI97_14225 [Siphonobacter sp. BAB-5405]|uniref:hypothetical protein n=1 Tax=Siphonobacter sp. BAB-5405 TaxID=1864825 RepID=UPI000C801C82|nr:hypothetical protein [Siphonobacter sp. BAB-5405]PMD95508.1 hypothetical protein BWI97_14225 [Siphonobacter sp. BAB-5405]